MSTHALAESEAAVTDRTEVDLAEVGAAVVATTAEQAEAAGVAVRHDLLPAPTDGGGATARPRAGGGLTVRVTLPG